ncbi:DNA polymerase epsilon catalytic subunit A-like [Centruroides sculpturatus]|uniref:DNA polymerase epsilon catalytic subunit A-like n=1 Tax=Centruroides sculpturatus TaxID=218467 RepID=UPI000C6EE81F|nr:DNA polymerase epsilon catalytic subunit A-like [Centruroides sculpturatus]
MVLRNTGRYSVNKENSSKDLLGSSKDDTSERRLQQSLFNDEIDLKFGFKRYQESAEIVGWLVNMHPTEILDEDRRLVSAVDYYFVQEDGNRFKVSFPFNPYFYIAVKNNCEQEVSSFLTRKFAGSLYRVEIIQKEDLDLPNHLIGLKKTYLKLSFLTVSDLIKVRKELLPTIKKNRDRMKSRSTYVEMLKNNMSSNDEKIIVGRVTEQMENIIDIREYDVPYHIRVSIDKKIFVGHWYSVRCKGTEPPEIVRRDDLLQTPFL